MQSRKAAALGTLLFFIIAPTTVTGIVPYYFTRWETAHPLPLGIVQQIFGWTLVVLGASALLHSFVRFVVEGIGTPAPVAPTERLVVGGLYRYVRNPIYVAVLSIIIGQAIAFGSASLLIYAGMVTLAVVGFVRLYEEPTLAARFGDEYEAYRRSVPRWFPRLSRHA